MHNSAKEVVKRIIVFEVLFIAIGISVLEVVKREVVEEEQRIIVLHSNGIGIGIQVRNSFQINVSVGGVWVQVLEIVRVIKSDNCIINLIKRIVHEEMCEGKVEKIHCNLDCSNLGLIVIFVQDGEKEVVIAANVALEEKILI